ncbi:23S rRNA (uracil(1939)-C(5))-methyltransferase RlmD [Levilactobacillus tujiorum]|uniref:23S rRNA (Uracil(1939)-C(5))-methyltransferase RlmD n=1 Tax=Levilactobacillus tujiorum TaxID=2912243 RepID=A0ABX1L2C3_9LACO|nr:23S rRNA (uracil(1939)-C(5))-methyltransferase RlmD [Levilactobacillus tujiorum]MCH5464099.1 23S rRNA (uracil(1939)-C(5))-methyltransferase RlmD [Levilactobacillus tujiorum]NLR11198.1 23S rRNA (uracil(1939)-C(5))-methyltransferase RlmD [Lactobacillus sp. HBUAS51387]NLR29175.1 23S rRNA (uracil(1939)-C(5))-methyltransferase RlmD [Levilactobacillus tujiorum]
MANFDSKSHRGNYNNRNTHRQAGGNHYRSTNRRRETPQVQVEVGQRFPLTIKRMGINGEGIGYYKRMAVFIPGALTDEEVVAEVTSVATRYLRAKVHRIRKTSPHRVEPRDSYADQVGGFELEHLDYPAQLRFKRDVVAQALERYQPEGYRHYDLRPTLGMDDPYAYRNKAQFQVRRNAEGQVEAGLYAERSHDLVDLPTCSVQIPVTMHVMRAVVGMLQDLDMPIYDEEQGSGIVKTLVVRAAAHTDDVQLVFITNSPKLPHKHDLLTRIAAELPEVTSVMQNVNPGKTSLVWGDDTRHLAGAEAITEKIDGLAFKLSARAFLQLNPYQMEVLYAEAKKALNLQPGENVVDAYSGIGTIGLSLANVAEEVRGMEVIPEAVADSNENAAANGITNAHYELGTAEELLPKWVMAGFHPDAIVVDPPRTGLDATLIETILAVHPTKLVYVSCNPSTLAKDLVELAHDYHVDYIQSVDMMPQTARCEAVVKLSRRS